MRRFIALLSGQTAAGRQECRSGRRVCLSPVGLIKARAPGLIMIYVRVAVRSGCAAAARAPQPDVFGQINGAQLGHSGGRQRRRNF